VQAARQYRDERGEIVTKHNSKLAGHRNAQKLVDLTVRTQSCLALPCLVLSYRAQSRIIQFNVIMMIKSLIMVVLSTLPLSFPSASLSHADAPERSPLRLPGVPACLRLPGVPAWAACMLGSVQDAVGAELGDMSVISRTETTHPFHPDQTASHSTLSSKPATQTRQTASQPAS